jgi:hypothetical protein
VDDVDVVDEVDVVAVVVDALPCRSTGFGSRLGVCCTCGLCGTQLDDEAELEVVLCRATGFRSKSLTLGRSCGCTSTAPTSFCLPSPLAIFLSDPPLDLAAYLVVNRDMIVDGLIFALRGVAFGLNGPKMCTVGEIQAKKARTWDEGVRGGAYEDVGRSRGWSFGLGFYLESCIYSRVVTEPGSKATRSSFSRGPVVRKLGGWYLRLEKHWEPQGMLRMTNNSWFNWTKNSQPPVGDLKANIILDIAPTYLQLEKSSCRNLLTLTA